MDRQTDRQTDKECDRARQITVTHILPLKTVRKYIIVSIKYLGYKEIGYSLFVYTSTFLN